MKTKGLIIAVFSAMILCMNSCDVHEFPEMPETRPFHLRLQYETDMTEWEHAYTEDKKIIETKVGETYCSVRKKGKIRYIIRTYNIDNKVKTSNHHIQEFVFERNITEGYDAEFTLDIIPGKYNLMVWSDMVENDETEYLYKISDLNEICIGEPHTGSNDYRDAFRGKGKAELANDIFERDSDTLNIIMQRPLARYEFVTNDFKKFIDKELDLLKKNAETKGEEPPTKLDTDSYKVVFYYSGFMPDTFFIFGIIS